jgi:hypothetical protein
VGLREVSSKEEFRNKISDFVSTYPPGLWIREGISIFYLKSSSIIKGTGTMKIGDLFSQITPG